MAAPLPAPYRLRPPTSDELPALHEMCMRAKASWGYDEEFMRWSKGSLHVSTYELRKRRVCAAFSGTTPVGVTQWSLDGCKAELDLLFVEPAWQGVGVGRSLLRWALEGATNAGVRSLGILSDPGAKPFYERQGARYMRHEPSESIPRRMLPWLELPTLRPKAPTSPPPNGSSTKAAPPR